MEQEKITITENVAEDLLNAFQKVNESLDEFMKTQNKVLENAYKEMALKVCERTLHYAEKYTNATFLTRWYWKRKLNKLAQATIEINDMFTEFKGNHYGNNDAELGA